MWFPEWPASHSVRWGRWATSWATDRFPLLGRFKTWRGSALIFRAPHTQAAEIYPNKTAFQGQPSPAAQRLAEMSHVEVRGWGICRGSCRQDWPQPSLRRSS